jgi:hypothetical protein
MSHAKNNLLPVFEHERMGNVWCEGSENTYASAQARFLEGRRAEV